MAHWSRRNFLKTGLAAGVLAGSGSLPLRSARRSATDWVTLGKSGVNVTRLAFGTGTLSGQTQRELGQDQFTRLVRHAYDRGIRFFETSETYGEMHTMLGVALKGIPRDTYRLMSKVTTREGVNPLEKIDELRRLANTDYFDVMLMHWQHVATWPTDTVRWQDGILEAQSKKVVVGHGASVHGLPALRRFPGNTWLEIAMIRVNHRGTVMDAEDYSKPSCAAARSLPSRSTSSAAAAASSHQSPKHASQGNNTSTLTPQSAIQPGSPAGAAGAAADVEYAHMLNQLINVAVAEKVSALRTEEYFRERSGRVNIGKAKRILKKAGRGKAPIAGDEI